MNKKTIALILLTAGLLTSSLVFLVFYLKTGKKRVEPTPTQFAASISLQTKQTTVAVDQTVPVTVAFTIDKDLSNKGIIGIKTSLSISPAGVFSLSENDIQSTLPSPWTYLRKEVTANGKITIEAIYLQLEESGFIASKSGETVAIVNLLAKEKGMVKLTLDKERSEIRAKEKNTNIPIRFKPESISLRVQ